MFEFNRTNKNIIFLIALTALTVIACTLWYYVGMNQLEDRPRTLIESLEWVTQTMTTVGYGQDAPWKHQSMYILAIITQLAGITIVFLSIPIVVSPWIQERMAVHPPTAQSMSDHVLIAGYSPIVNELIDRLEERGIAYVLVDEGREAMTDLHRRDYTVAQGEPDDPDVLKDASIEQARMIVLDGTDQELASTALSTQEFNIDVPIIAVADQPERERHLRSAGVDNVIYPKEKIGDVLGRKALMGLGQHDLLDEDLETDIEIQELPVLPRSPLAGKQLKNSGIREQTGAHIIGLWRKGSFHNKPQPDEVIRKNDILVAAGRSDSLDKLADKLEARRTSGEQNVLIIGYGKEGTAADDVLKEHGLDPVRVDRRDLDGAIVGDGKAPETLKEAGIETMDSVLIAVSSDDAAIFITLMVRDMNPMVEILVQVNEADSSFPVYRAGANYVQALDQLTARLLAEYVLDEELVYEELNLQVGRFTPGDLVGTSPHSINIGSEYDVTVVGVERNDRTIMEFDEKFTFQADDVLYLSGAPEAVRQFEVDYQLAKP